MSKELKRCPFCGGEAAEEIRRFGLEKINRYGAGCPICCVWFGWYEDEDEAVERWNRRAKDENGVSKAKVKELIWSGLSLDTDADKEYVCGLIDELEGKDEQVTAQ